MATPFFHLKGRTLVLIDWANVFHAQRKNGCKQYPGGTEIPSGVIVPIV